MKVIISMEALTPAIRKPWCVLILCCNTRIAAASGLESLGPAVIHTDTGLSFFGLVTWGWWLPGHPCCMAGFCLHLQALEEILMFAQFWEQNISSISLNSSWVCFPTCNWKSEYCYKCMYVITYGREPFFFRSVLEENDRGKEEIGRTFT